MSRNKIKDLSKEQIISGFLYCHDNAKKLLEAGKLLFNNKFTAYANSLLILAVEEEIKGFIIYGVILNPEFSQSLDFEALFGKHKIKKEVAKAAFWYWENLARHIKQVGVDNILNNPEIHLESFLQSEVTTGKGSSKNDARINNWFSQMPTERETGLYVDFLDKEWLCPDRINETGYLDSLEISQVLVGIGDTMLNLLSRQPDNP